MCLLIVLCVADLWDTHLHNLSTAGIQAHGGLELVVSIITNTTKSNICFMKVP